MSAAGPDRLVHESGCVRLALDLKRGGVLGGLWLDPSGAGTFDNQALLADTGRDQGLVLELVELPGQPGCTGHVPVPAAAHQPGPRESWFCPRPYRLRTFTDSCDVVERDGVWRAAITGHFTWGGRWPYRLVWELPASGPPIRVTLEMLPGRHEPRPSLVRALGMTFRMHYRSAESFHARTARFGIDDRVIETEAEVVRRWVGAETYLQKSELYGIPSVGEIPWPDYNLTCLLQAGSAACELWKAVGPESGKLSVWRGRQSRGWLHVSDGEWGLGLALAGLSGQAPASLETDLDLGDGAAEIGTYLWPRGARLLDARGPDEERLLQARTMLLLPQAGPWSDERAVELDRAAGLDGTLPSAEPDPTTYAFSPPANLPEPVKHGVRFLVDEPAKVDRHGWPVTVGVPVGQGAFASVADLALVDDGGTLCPFQAEPLAFWPDGSLKWVLLDFQADLPAGRGAVFGLGPIAGRNAPAADVEVRACETEGSVRVETGPLAFEIDRDGSGFVDRAWLDAGGDGRFEADAQIVTNGGARRSFLDFLNAQDYRPGVHTVRGVPDLSELRIDTLAVERAGPLRAVVLIRGEYLNRVPSPFTVRIEAFAGKPYVRIQHTFTYTMDPDFDFLLAAGVSLPLSLGSARRMTFGTAGAVQRITDGSVAGLLSEGPDRTVLWAGAADAPVGRDVAECGRTAGWADISDGRWGVTVAVRHFWKEFAKEVLVDAGAGVVTAHFHPPQAPPLDLRRYSPWMYVQTGETTRPWPGQADFRNGAFATGLAKTSSAVFSFHGGPVDPDEADALARSFEDRPIAVLAPECWRRLGIAGDFSPPDPERFPALESRWRDIADLFVWSREQSNWYGMIDYGDIQHMWRPAFRARDGSARFRDGWHFDIGRHGWQNTEGQDGLGYFLAFLRSGARAYFDAAAANARHVEDVDIFHWGPLKGYGHTRHNVNHWGDGDTEIRISQPSTYRFYYYLTGDARARDVIEQVVDGLYLTSKSEATVDMGAIGYGLLVRWEMTGDARYRDRLRDFFAAYATCQLPDGQLPLSGFTIDVAGGRREDADTKELCLKGVDGFTHDFGFMHALTEYHELTGDETVGRMLDRHARWCFEQGKSPLIILSHMARRTGDPVFVEGVRRGLAAFLHRETGGVYIPEDRTRWYGQWPDMERTGSGALTFLLYKLPFAMRALALAGKTEKELG